MLKPSPLQHPRCPMCREPGIHKDADACIAALKAAIAAFKSKG